MRYNVNWLLCTKLINDCVCVSKKFAENFCPVCVHKTLSTLLYSHTPLTSQLTCLTLVLPPHLIKTLRAMTGRS